MPLRLRSHWSFDSATKPSNSQSIETWRFTVWSDSFVFIYALLFQDNLLDAIYLEPPTSFRGHLPWLRFWERGCGATCRLRLLVPRKITTKTRRFPKNHIWHESFSSQVFKNKLSLIFYWTGIVSPLQLWTLWTLPSLAACLLFLL